MLETRLETEEVEGAYWCRKGGLRVMSKQQKGVWVVVRTTETRGFVDEEQPRYTKFKDSIEHPLWL